MLYLTTGANGAGKTLFTLRDVRAMQLKENRPVAYNGRFDMKADFGWKKIDFKNWQDEPDGTIFFIDECHNDMPTRSGASVPEHIRMLGEHRKRGFDFFLVTQHPLNIDSFVRRLIGSPGWHRHIKRMAGAAAMSSILRWTAVKENCDKEGVGASAEVELSAFPKEVFDWYDSASLHTGKRKIPKRFWTLLACILLIPTLGAIAYKQVMSRYIQKPEAAATAVPGAAPGQPGAQPPRPPGANSNERKPMTTAEYLAAYKPRIEGLMHSAPMYDGLTQPKRVPLPAACVSMPSKGCKCFTQDATPYPIDVAMCRGLVEHGAFYAFVAERERVQHGREEKPIQAAQPVAEQRASVTLIGVAPEAVQAAPAAPAEPPPQRIGSYRR